MGGHSGHTLMGSGCDAQRCGRGCEDGLDRCGSSWSPEEEALRLIATEGDEVLELTLLLHSFCGDLQAECVAERDHVLDHHPISGCWSSRAMKDRSILSRSR